mgnify:CR=1 FL=1
MICGYHLRGGICAAVPRRVPRCRGCLPDCYWGCCGEGKRPLCILFSRCQGWSDRANPYVAGGSASRLYLDFRREGNGRWSGQISTKPPIFPLTNAPYPGKRKDRFSSEPALDGTTFRMMAGQPGGGLAKGYRIAPICGVERCLNLQHIAAGSRIRFHEGGNFLVTIQNRRMVAVS